MQSFQPKKNGKIYIEFSIEFQVKFDINNAKFRKHGYFVLKLTIWLRSLKF